jgi:phosphoenolpyruvate synthase/pyruvate phosphate dikinase
MNLIKLTDCIDQPASKIGGKALGLAKLTHIHGISTSPGFVIPAGYRVNEHELESLWRELGLSCVAVRSSGIAEDSSKESLAGKYDTQLGVTADSLMRSINQVRESAPGAMAVIVQEMIASVVSGVMFTESPLDQSKIMISAAYGLGRVIAEGECTPQTITVNSRNESMLVSELDQPYRYLLKDCRVIQSNDVPHMVPLPQDESIQLAQLGRKIEQSFERPQDIEWAIDKERRFVILQSRPITTQ